ncbi:hypothetical protein BC938DRAFT_481933 [Jimgerdemannia flammicorona]|nr:hypothetical protein BC938DRAFT_481933 [Jimgerdemannia flammicorona]
MRDVLYAFFSSNANASDDDLHEMFVLGFQSWGWTHQVYGMDCKATNVCRYGKLCTTVLPNSTRTLACLEAFYINMLNIKATLSHICDKANEIALTHARAHRRLKRREEEIQAEHAELGGCFGEITGTPEKKRRN